MKTHRLIINADDANLTRGVTQGILEAHEEGIVTSTTLLMNLPLSEKTVRDLKKRKRLGLGVHLNMTLGGPVSHPADVPTLLKPDGRFRRPVDYAQKRPSEKEVAREYEAQIKLFVKHFADRPDHLDTHHHLHDDPLFFGALKEVAKKWKIPVRRSRIFQLEEFKLKTAGLKTTDYLFGNLEACYIWQRDSFLGVMENFPEGTGEIGCHPGYCDPELRQMSSMQEVREKELRLFSDSTLHKALSRQGIEMIRFSDL